MSFNQVSTEVKLAPNGSVYLGPLGSTAPTDATAAVDAAYVAVGYIDEKGVTITPKVTTVEVNAWQSALPVKVGIKTIALDAKFVMIQDTGTSAGAFFFDQSFTYNTGTAKLVIPASPTLVERAAVIEWIADDGKKNRLSLQRVIITDRDALVLDRNSATAFGVTMAVLTDASGNVGTFYSENTEYLIGS